jgi:hypothetical protein
MRVSGYDQGYHPMLFKEAGTELGPMSNREIKAEAQQLL